MLPDNPKIGAGFAFKAKRSLALQHLAEPLRRVTTLKKEALKTARVLRFAEALCGAPERPKFIRETRSRASAKPDKWHPRNPTEASAKPGFRAASVDKCRKHPRNPVTRSVNERGALCCLLMPKSLKSPPVLASGDVDTAGKHPRNPEKTSAKPESVIRAFIRETRNEERPVGAPAVDRQR
ncbi:hypothetical protein NMB33_40065 (plasmid) [Burkholderia sp. FXe9]|nr:hypothetical protein NMB33_40065 [Burkholderia sp. FXe9]